MATVRLSKSKKGVLFYPGDGSIHVTSAAFMRMLLDSKLNGDMLMMNRLKDAHDAGIGNIEFKKKAGDGNIDFGGL